VLYGQSFAIYGLSEYYLATGNHESLGLAELVFDLIQRNCVDSFYGGYFEMFEPDWTISGPGSRGGDRKTLDTHLHLMEAFTTLYEATGKELHRRKLLEAIEILLKRMLHPRYGTGIAQFFPDWTVAPQIKFDIVWGWDRYSEGGAKEHATDTTSFGHNVEVAWLLNRADSIARVDRPSDLQTIRRLVDHCVLNGIDPEFGGVYVEGAHSGGVYDRQREFWQQAEVLIGMLDTFLLFGETRFLDAFGRVWDFVREKVINHPVGEWWPLLTREGTPIWRHMSHSWKTSYHTVRSMIQCAQRLRRIR